MPRYCCLVYNKVLDFSKYVNYKMPLNWLKLIDIINHSFHLYFYKNIIEIKNKQEFSRSQALDIYHKFLSQQQQAIFYLNLGLMQQESAALFRAANLQLQAKIDSDPFSLSSLFWINRSSEKIVPVILKNRYMIICEKRILQGYSPLFYVELNFDLKFQIIYEGYQYLTTANAASKKIGFRLRKKQALVEFQIVHQNQIDIWIQYLSKSLPQYLSQQNLQALYKPYKKLYGGLFISVYDMYKFIDHKHFAVKIFPKRFTNNVTSIQFQRYKCNVENEVSVMKILNHPNIIKFQKFHESKHYIYMVLELLQLGNLQDRIQDRIRQKRKFQDYQLKQFMTGMAKALKYLHQNGIIHRDLNPTNIMMRDKKSMFPIIMGFGLSVYPGYNDRILQEGGKAGYLSRQYVRYGRVNSAHDIYSTGAIFYYLLTLKPLFQGSDLEIVHKIRNYNLDLNTKFHNNIDGSAHELLRNMLRMLPADRISAGDMLKHSYLSDWVQRDMEEKQTIPTETTVEARHTIFSKEQ